MSQTHASYVIQGRFKRMMYQMYAQ